MFSQRRKKYRNMVWASVLTTVTLLAFILLLGYLGSFRNQEPEKTPVNETVTIKEEAPTEVEEIKKETYYLLKCDNDIVRVYFSDEKGELIELEETAIIYETLSVEDQAQLQEGIQIESREVLNRLLMDYES